MSDKYKLKPVDFLSWYGLLNSAPKQWKKKLQIEPTVINTLDEDSCLLSVKDKVIDISSLTPGKFMTILYIQNTGHQVLNSISQASLVDMKLNGHRSLFDSTQDIN